MKAYRKTIKNRINLFSLLILIAAALGVYDTFFASKQIKASPMFNFQLGLTAALALTRPLWAFSAINGFWMTNKS